MSSLFDNHPPALSSEPLEEGAVILHGYLEKPEDFLWTILVGNTLANLAAVGLLAVLLHQWLGNWPILLTVSFLAVMFLFYALCELLPKMAKLMDKVAVMPGLSFKSGLWTEITTS